MFTKRNYVRTSAHLYMLRRGKVSKVRWLHSVQRVNESVGSTDNRSFQRQAEPYKSVLLDAVCQLKPFTFFGHETGIVKWSNQVLF